MILIITKFLHDFNYQTISWIFRLSSRFNFTNLLFFVFVESVVG